MVATVVNNLLLYAVLGGFLTFVVAPRFTVRLCARVGLGAGARWRRLWPQKLPPTSRPIEAIARDAWRIGTRYHAGPDGLRFPKAEGIRLAYDDVLAEACEALGITHLLRVLPPGTECDTERRRVEYLLGQAGLDLPDAA